MGDDVISRVERWSVRASDSPTSVELWAGDERIVTAECTALQKWPVSDVFQIIAKAHNEALDRLSPDLEK